MHIKGLMFDSIYTILMMLAESKELNKTALDINCHEEKENYHYINHINYEITCTNWKIMHKNMIVHCDKTRIVRQL